MDSHIEFSNYTQITKEGVALLENVSFCLPKGKTTVLLGLKEEGQSTLMDAISGFCSDSHDTFGSVRVRQHGVLVERDIQRWFNSVEYIKQSGIDFNQLSVDELLSFVCVLKESLPELINPLLRTFKLCKVRSTKHRNLSSREKKRVSVVIGILSNAELKLWDEPFDFLDSVMALQALTEIKRRPNTTNLISVGQVTDELLALFDYVILMHRRTVVYCGTKEELVPFFKTEHNIHFRGDHSFPSYAMVLCSNIPEDALDAWNIDRFNALVNAIKGRAQAMPSKSNAKVVQSFKLRFGCVLTVLYGAYTLHVKRPMILVIFVLLKAAIPILMCSRFLGETKDSYKYTLPYAVAYYTKIAPLLPHPTSATQSIHKLAQNLPAFDLVTKDLSIGINILLLWVLLSTVCTTQLAYRQTCKQLIEERYFSILEYIAAVALECFFLGCLLTFATLYALLASIECHDLYAGIIGVSEFSHALIAGCMALTSMHIAGLLLIVHLSPFAGRLRLCWIVGLYAIFIFLPMTLLYVRDIPIISYLPYNWTLSVEGVVENALSLDRNEILYKLPRIKQPIDWILTYGLGSVYSIVSPSILFLELIGKWALYKTYLPWEGIPPTFVGYLHRLMMNGILRESADGTNIQSPLNSMDKQPIDINTTNVVHMITKTRKFNAITSLIWRDAEFTSDITIWEFLKVPFRFFTVISIGTTLGVVYTYRKLQPQIR